MHIKAENINKSFSLDSKNKIQILFDVNISIQLNEFVALMGPSGAGKSTLLYILGTLENADSGIVHFNENNEIIKINDLNENKLSKFRNKNIGFIFQFHHLLPEFTALENVMMPTLILGETSNVAKYKAMELLKDEGVENRANHKPNELSGGEQQRVAIARALINDPKYLFADEPTGNLDSENTINVINLLQKIKYEKNLTMIIATHSEVIAKNADRIINMKDGKII